MTIDTQSSIEMPNSPRLSSRWLKRFGAFGLATIIIIYLLILVGGVVRATGSGMGCPDWPTCFGQWVPPTHESQLPENYQQIYAERGYRNTTFNVQKTWTEYLNRLLGVFTGLMILGTLIASIPFRRRDQLVFQLSLAGFLLVGVQGWLGSRVVASNLHPGMITIHMLLAQVIVAILILAIARSQISTLSRDPVSALPRWLGMLLWVIMLCSLVQLVMGTQVREAIDLIARENNHTNRHLWIDSLPNIYAFHQYFAIVVALLNVLLLYVIFTRVPSGTAMFQAAVVLAVVLMGTLVMGLSMQRMHLPMYAQPLHLWLASMIFGAQFYLYIIWRWASNASLSQSREATPHSREGV